MWRGKDSEAPEENVQEGTRVHRPSNILDQDSILSLVTRHLALGEGRLGGGCWGENTGFLFSLQGHPKSFQIG